MTIPSAYLQRPNSAQGTDAALRSTNAFGELAFKFAELRAKMLGLGAGGGSSASSSNQMSGTTTSKDVKADANQRMKHRESQAKVAEQTKRTNLMGRVSPEDKEKKQLANQMKKEKIEDSRVTRAKSVMNDALQWAPQITQETYRDMYDLVGESDSAAAGLMVSPDKIEAMTPIEWKVQHSKLNDVFTPSDKRLANVVKAQEKADKEALAAEKRKQAGYKEYIRIQAALDRAGNTGGLEDTDYETLGPAVKAFLRGKDRSKYIGLLGEYAQKLVDKHGFDPTPRAAVPPPEIGGAELSDSQMAQYKKMYGDKYTEEEIRAQYKKYVGGQ
jgi:hypothetical protein